jgi:3D (Asp-Asp-Asp) domain-containing protein
MGIQARALAARSRARRQALPAAIAIAAAIGMLGAALLASTAEPVELHGAEPFTSEAAIAEVAIDDLAAVTPSAELAVPQVEAYSQAEIRWFDNRPIRPVRTITMLVTAYSPDEQSCGEWADGITASGYSVRTNGGMLVAADTRILPFGSLLSIPGYDGGHVVPVLDRGGAIKGNRLDVLYPTHEDALEWGVQRLEVTVWEYADDGPAGLPRR